MAKLTRLGELERAVMDHLWSSGEPQTVRQVHEALSARRDLAYTTIMTVLQRLAKKNLVVQHRDDRAHRYAPTHGRDELVAGLMVDALDQAADSGSREAALVHFVERVGADEAAALRRALAELESKTTAHVRSGRTPNPRPLAIRAPAERYLQRVRAGLHHRRAAPVGTSPGNAGASVVADARTARRHRAVAVHRPGRRVVGVLGRHRDRQPAVRARDRTAAPPPPSPVRSTRWAGRCGWPTSSSSPSPW